LRFDLERYRGEAERFSERLSREYYLHLSGQKPELELEPIYVEHRDLFGRAEVGTLRELCDAAAGDAHRRLRYLLHFAFDGLIGAETRAESAELAGLEAALEVEAPDGSVPYRAVAVEQANEPDPERRAALEEARNALLEERLNPLHRSMLQRAHELSVELGWTSYVEAYGELRGIDLRGLAEQTEDFLAATRDVYPELLDPELERAGVPALGALRRSDLPRFFRAADLDEGFPAERLVRTFSETLAAMGLDLSSQANVRSTVKRR